MNHTETLFLAVDPGAGNTKIFSQHLEPVMIRSLVKFGTETDFIASYQDIAADVLHYVDGSNENLKGQYWIAGGSVIDRKIKPDTPYEEASLKLTNALPLLLTGLIREAKIAPGEVNIVLIVSSHNPIAQGSKLKKELEGWHEVICNHKRYKIQIKMPKSGVFAEGSAIEQGTEFATLDIGYLTALVTPRSRDGLALADRAKRSDLGVGNLVDRIANHPDLESMLGGLPANPIYVGNGLIEAAGSKTGTVFYRGDGKCLDISDVYLKCLKTWIPDAIGPALKALAERSGTKYKVIAIGGGSKLPKMAEFLKHQGITMYKGDPLLANAESLYTHKLLPLLGGDLGEPVEKFDFEPFDSVSQPSSKKTKTKPAKAETEVKEPAVA